MKIVSGIARNLDLQTPDTLGVRPTAIRSRKALFDSLYSDCEELIRLLTAITKTLKESENTDH